MHPTGVVGGEVVERIARADLNAEGLARRGGGWSAKVEMLGRGGDYRDTGAALDLVGGSRADDGHGRRARCAEGDREGMHAVVHCREGVVARQRGLGIAATKADHTAI